MSGWSTTNDINAPVEVHIEPATIVAGLAAASRNTDDGYAAACALMQVWSDLRLVAEGSEQSSSVRRRARAGAARASRSAFDVAYGHRSVRLRSAGAAITLRGRLSPWQETLGQALTTPMPECYGYDLGDTRVCLEDAKWFARERAHGRPMVVAGIRGGGAFLAPRWAAGVALEIGVPPSWTTLRPLGTASQRHGYHPIELDALRALCSMHPVMPAIVIVDDQPDTGSTVDRLAEVLAPLADSLWFACIGKVSRLHAAGLWSRSSARSVLQPRERTPLWQLLLREDRSRFLDTLTNAFPQVAANVADLSIRCPTLEARYGRQHAWLPWNDPTLRRRRRQLVNPRKTPLVVTDTHGAPLLHLRFIGEGAFGLCEFQRVQGLLPMHGKAWFLDGYRVAEHIPGLRPLRSLLADTSHVDTSSWLLRCLESLHGNRGKIVANVVGRFGDMRVGERIARTLDHLRKHVHGALPEQPAWLRDARVPAFGGSQRPTRSALSHAFGYWHWQVDENNAPHRFHLEANWGCLSWPELEIAAFLLEHRLGPEALMAMKNSDVARAVRWPAVVVSMPVAAMLWLDGCSRELRQISPAGAALWRDDLCLLWKTLSQYVDFFHPRVLRYD